MKKIYLALAFASAACASASAQGIPNPGFEDNNGEAGWELRIPYFQARPYWHTWYNQEAVEQLTQDKIFISPKGWDVSNNLGVMVSNNVLASPVKVAERVDGKDGSDYAVKLTNMLQGNTPSFVFPGYLTLGTAFFSCEYHPRLEIPFAGLVIQEGHVDNIEYGSFGGTPYNGRPDAIGFCYMREGEGQDATAIAYSWIGMYEQKEVPANTSSNPLLDVRHYDAGEVMINENQSNEEELPSINMYGRDRNILGMETIVGGELTHSDNSCLVASGGVRISDFPTDWELCEIPLAYNYDVAPDSLNIIVCAGDYFGDPADLVAGNSITVDDFKEIYWSRIKSVSVGGKTFEMTAGEYDYEIPADYPANPADFSVIPLGQGCEITGIEEDKEYDAIFVTVANKTGEDLDGLDEHTYEFVFTGVAAIDGINAETAAPVYYNLQGVRVNPDVPGVYVKRTGNRTVKVVVK